MLHRSNRAFIHSLLVATLVVIGSGGVAGLGAVWLRHQISDTAKRIALAERKLDAAERALADTRLQLAAAESIESLERRDAEWHLGLVPPRDPQLVLVTAADQARLAARRGGGVSSRELPALLALSPVSAARRP